MKWVDFRVMVEKNPDMCVSDKTPGVYGILVDDKCVYLAYTDVDCRQALLSELYRIENAMLNPDEYLHLLLSAKLGGHEVRGVQIVSCERKEAFEHFKRYLAAWKPILNQQGKWKIEEVLNQGVVVEDKRVGDYVI